MSKVYQPYHLVNPSSRPYSLSLSLLLTASGAVLLFHYNILTIFIIGFLLKDVIR